MKAEARPKVIGARVQRVEDPRLLAGQGAFIDDLNLPGTLHVAFCRSDHAHARIVDIESAEASRMPGVAAVITAADIAGKNLGRLFRRRRTSAQPRRRWR